MSGFVRDPKNIGKKPPGYYRTHLTIKDMRRVMAGAGPLSVTQIAALTSNLVPPEAKRRCFEMSNSGSGSRLTLDGMLFVGMRCIIQLHLPQLLRKGKVKKHGSGREAKYEWIEAENNQTGQDSA